MQLRPRLYSSLEEMLCRIDPPNCFACLRILSDNLELFETTPGSTHNHQTWPGGYIDHVTDVMNIGIRDFNHENCWRRLSFSLSDVLLVLFLHDLEKPWKYETGQDGHLRHKEGLVSAEEQHLFRDKKIKEYGVVLTPKQENALRYIHGEGDDYSNRQRVMNELAAFCHCCDVKSARIFYNYPLDSNDPWFGARRFRSR